MDLEQHPPQIAPFSRFGKCTRAATTDWRVPRQMAPLHGSLFFFSFRTRPREENKLKRRPPGALASHEPINGRRARWETKVQHKRLPRPIIYSTYPRLTARSAKADAATRDVRHRLANRRWPTDHTPWRNQRGNKNETPFICID